MSIDDVVEKKETKTELKQKYSIEEYTRDIEICYYTTLIGTLTAIPLLYLALLFSN